MSTECTWKKGETAQARQSLRFSNASQKLWNGATPTIIRATLLSASVLACYSEAKIFLHEKVPKVFPDKEGIPLMFTGTMIASLVANVVSNPFDVVKSRIQNMPIPKVLPTTPVDRLL